MGWCTKNDVNAMYILCTASSIQSVIRVGNDARNFS